MLISIEELAQFSGVVSTSETLPTIYINSSTEVINAYLGFNCQKTDNTNPFYNVVTEALNIPATVKLVCLEIATLMQLEEGQNIGVNSNNFQASGSRSFLNVTDYSKYLKRIASYRVQNTL